MYLRDNIIKKVNQFLQEDATDQFIMCELEAVIKGDPSFTVMNKLGEEVQIHIIYFPHADVIDYYIGEVRCKMLYKKQTQST